MRSNENTIYYIFWIHMKAIIYEFMNSSTIISTRVLAIQSITWSGLQ